MKTIEQKAKAYDETIEKLRDFYRDYNTISCLIDVKEELANLFPELKESEDERIKEKLKMAVEQTVWLDSDKNECIDWLEKQSDEARNIALRTEYEKGRADAIAEISKMSKEVDNQIWQIANNSAKTWEQSFAILQATQTAYNKGKKDALKEQKPTDKTEPKFHEGDWVVYVCGEESTTLQISRIIEGTYEFTDGSSLNVVDEDTLHLWTIEDAKDGDMLITNKKQPFIFNGHYDKDTDYIYAYCGISDLVKDDSFLPCDEEFKVWCTNENVCPATKEQRSLLFKKMEEAGYEWDADKKDLKKIEQKPESITDEWIEDYWQHEKVNNPHSYDKGEEIQFDHQGFVRFCKKYCKKPAEWSEEDEIRLNHILRLLDVRDDKKYLLAFGLNSLQDLEKDIVWLKSLKDRIGG